MLIDLASRQRVEALERRIVVIVEDDPRLLRAMSDSVAGMNLDVLLAKHYDAAIRHLEGRRAHLVCVDIGLPDRSGYELCEYMRSRSGFARVPILATGEHGTSHDLAQAEYAGANGFLLKPFAIRKFTLCVRSMLDGRRGRTSPMRDLGLANRFPADFAASTPRRAVIPVSAA
jgi:DNA-binding response OmpR family regulator